MHIPWHKNFVMECGLPVTVWAFVVAFKFCNGLLGCSLWFAVDCVYELGLLHTTCTIFKFHG